MGFFFTFMVELSVVLSLIALLIFFVFYFLYHRKSEIEDAADAAGYESPKQYMRDTLGERPRVLSISAFLNDDAKSIGIRYIVASLFFFFIAGTFGLTMRLSLTVPTPSLLSAQEYNVLLTEHATLMIYMWAVGSAIGFAYYLLPSHLKLKHDSRGVYASSGFWFWFMGGLMILYSRTAARWYLYPPLALQLSASGGGIDNWLAVIGLEAVFFGLMITSINVILIIWKDRDPAIKWSQMSMFAWSILFTAIMIVASAPPLMVGLSMLFYDFFNPIFFTGATHEVLLFAILFWFWGHPIVYVAVIPYFGLIYEIIPKFTNKPIYSYGSGIFGLGLLLILSEFVWGHHLLNSGLGLAWVLFYTTASFAVVVPSAITVFNYVASLWSAEKIRLTTPMLFAINGIMDFVIGGVTGVMQSNQGINQLVHGTYFVTGHFHFIFMGITTGISFAAFYMLFPTLSGGRTYNVRLARLHFYFTAFGSLLMAMAWTVGGLIGMPRAVAGYLPVFQPYQDASILGGLIIGIGQLIFLYNIATSWLKEPSLSLENALEYKGDEAYNAGGVPVPNPIAAEELENNAGGA